ncbi:MAG: type II methionyl aminopeptidase [Nanoarchaeota archaeon]
METEEIEKLKKAGKIASDARDFARKIIKRDMPLLEIAEKIEAEIERLGGKPAFPVNLSINSIAAHYTPGFDDKTTASGILKVDIGVHIDGEIADTALTIDLENSSENKELIESAETALKEAIETAKKDVLLSEVGRTIQKSIEKSNLKPIANLSGHAIEKWKVHAGATVPNIDNKTTVKFKHGVYAIEPFVTNGDGAVYEGRPSGIYQYAEKRPVRDIFARRVVEFITTEYKTLPFCQRWIVKKFGVRSLLALHFLEQQGILRQYPQLIERGNGNVAQAEHTILITDSKTEVVTE